MTHGATWAAMPLNMPSSAQASKPLRLKTSSWAVPHPKVQTGANIARQIALRAGCPSYHLGHDRQPLLLFGLADHCHGVSACHCQRRRHLCSRWRGGHLVRPAGNEPAHAVGPLAGQEQARDLLEHAANRPKTWPSATTSAARPWTSTALPASRRRLPRWKAGLFKAEIAPITVTMGVADKVMGPDDQAGHRERR
jgi:acetyl-CoA C-acetyltransferase